ncbi:MAG: hypothetical protein QOD06_884 [Candidatus Binatota bacterium]|nr:hypothetical protein [Candidatus Binatota bacterium]
MLQNPIVQIAMMFVGAYYALNVLSRVWPPLGPTVTVVSGALAAVLWVLEYERRLAADLYRTNPIARPLLDLVCRATGRQLPIGDGGIVAVAETANVERAASSRSTAASSGTASEPVRASGTKQGPRDAKLLLDTDADFFESASRLKSVVRGHDAIIDGILAQLRQNVRLRQRADPHAAQPPLGLFLFVGKPGLGKRYLAEQIAWLVYEDGPLVELDVTDEASASPRRLIEAVKAKPNQTIILENVDAATPQYLERLQAIASGNSLRDPTSGAVVGFRNCVFFLISHKPAEPIAAIRQEGVTMLTAAIAELVGLPPSLVTMINDYYAFLLPSQIEQAEIVALLMEQECRKYNVRLGQVDPEMLSREVNAISASGGFAI